MPSQTLRARSLVELCLWLGLAGLAYGFSFSFADEKGSYAWGAASWPRAVALLMAVTAVIHFVAQRRAKPVAAAQREQTDPAERRKEIIHIAGLFVLPLAYLWLLPRIGFYVSTPIFLVAYLLYLGERRPRFLIGVPLIIYGLIVLVFTVLFYVALPVGNWPVFYDVSNALLEILK